jgi:phosphoglycolate phosphatase-like HAD superfamily hydrolase
LFSKEGGAILTGVLKEREISETGKFAGGSSADEIERGLFEILHDDANRRRPRIALFDFDGTVSLIRTGWEDVMVPMMVEILAGLNTGEPEEDLRALVTEYVARLTGEQTIYQMIELAQQVESRGGKPLEALQYKKMYHDRLMQMIRDRREDLRHGRVSPEQYLVPGVTGFLEALRARGLKLYCASGTDEVFTIEEARLVGVDHYFDGGIYGALDDYKSFSKEILIRRLVSSMECRGDELVGFGDGYVEIKNVKDAGGLAVGVATDEPGCKTVNQWKRTRLVNVGADFIVPNFLARDQLLSALFPE